MYHWGLVLGGVSPPQHFQYGFFRFGLPYPKLKAGKVFKKLKMATLALVNTNTTSQKLGVWKQTLIGMGKT